MFGSFATMPRASAVLALAGIFFAAFSIAAASPASAACSEDFRARWINSSTLGSGTQNDIYVRNRSLSTSCDGAEAHSTARVGDPNNSQRWAEIGWVERWTNGAGSSHQWDLFWEYKDGTMMSGGFNSGIGISCCDWYRFRVRYSQPDGNGWKFFYDPGANGNFIQLHGLSHPGFTQGHIEAETSRRPQSETSLRDHQRNLQWIQCGSGCTWQDWTHNNDETGAPGGWHWVRISATEHWMCPDTDPSGPC